MDWPLMSSESVFSEEVNYILHKLGLELEDLENLVSYPEDQTTPEKLPFIVNQIRLQKAQRSLETVQSQTDPEPREPNETEDPENTSKDTGILEEEISETGGSGDKNYNSSSFLTDVGSLWEQKSFSKDSPDPLNCELKNQSLNQPSQAAQVLLEDGNSDLTSPSSEILPAPPLKGSEPEIPPDPQPSSSPIKVSQSGRHGLVLYDSLNKQPTTSFTEHVKEQQQKPRLNPSHPGEDAPDQDSLSLCNPSLTDSMQTVVNSMHVALSTSTSELVSYPIPAKHANVELDHGQHPAERKASKGLQLLPVSHQQAQISTPGPFPHTCPLCFQECTDMAEWISHQKTNLHLKNYTDAVGEEARYSSVATPKHQSRKTKRSCTRSRSKSPRCSRSSKSQREKQRSNSQSHSSPCRRTQEVRRTKRNSRSRSPASYCRKRRTRQSRSASSPRTGRRPAKKADSSSRSSSHSSRSCSKSPRRSHSSKSQQKRQSSGSQSHSPPCHRTQEVRRTKRKRPAGYHHETSMRQSRSPSSPRACRRPAKRAHRSSWSSSLSSRSCSKSPRRSNSQSHSSPCSRTQELRRTKRNSRSRSPASYCHKSSARQSRSPSSSPRTGRRPAKRADRSCQSSSRSPQHRRRRRRSSQSPRQLPLAYIYRNSSRSRSSRDSPRQSRSRSPKSRVFGRRRPNCQSFSRRYDRLRSPRKRSEGLDSPRQASPKKRDERKPSPRRSERQSFRRLSPKRNSESHSPPRRIDKKGSSLRGSQEGKLSSEMSCPRRPSMEETLTQKLLQSAVVQSLPKGVDVVQIVQILTPALLVELDSRSPSSSNPADEASPSMSTKLEKNEATSAVKHKAIVSANKQHKQLNVKPIGSEQMALKSEESKSKSTAGGKESTKNTSKSRSEETVTINPKLLPKITKTRTTDSAKKLQEKNTSQTRKPQKSQLSDKNPLLEGRRKPKYSEESPESRSDASQEQPEVSLLSDTRVSESKDETCTPNTTDEKPPPGRIQAATKNLLLDNPSTIKKSGAQETNSRTKSQKTGSVDLIMEITGDSKNYLIDEDLRIRQEATTYTINHQNSSSTLDTKGDETVEPMALVETTEVERFVDTKALPNIVSDAPMLSQKPTYVPQAFTESVVEEAETRTDALQIQEDTTGTKSQTDLEEVKEDRSTDQELVPKKDEDDDREAREELSAFIVNHQNASLTVDTKGNKSIEPVTALEPFVARGEDLIDTKVLPKILSNSAKPKDHLQDKTGTIMFPKCRNDPGQVQEETSSRTNSQKINLEVEDGSFCVIKNPESLSEVKQEATTSTLDHQKTLLIKPAEPESFRQTDASSNRTSLEVDTVLRKPPTDPPQAPLDDPLDLLLDLIRSTKEYCSRLKEASIQPNEGQSSSIGIEAENRVETSTESTQSRPPNNEFCIKKDAFEPKTKYLTSPVPEAEVVSSSAAVRFPTPGERIRRPQNPELVHGRAVCESDAME